VSPDDPRHGTYAGGRIHRKHGQKPCDPCSYAEARYERGRTHDRYNGRPRTIPSNGTTLRLRALFALGHTYARIGAELGFTTEAARRLAAHPPPLIRATTAARITRLYDAWSMTLPPATTRSETKSATYARNLAARKGWLPPLALDDDRLDDPTYTPRRTVERGVTYDHAVVERVLSGERSPRQLRRAESAEIVRRARGRGLSDGLIYELYGIKAERHPNTVEVAS